MAAALDAALEALTAPAFVVGPHYKIEVANRAGLSLLARDHKSVTTSIRQSALAGPGRAFSITHLGRAGEPAYLLAIRKESSGVVERVALAQKRWGLSVRQARVLELVATGASNKEIAGTLACAEATVENHLTELFRRSGARSRAGLVGRLIA
jgi:DNA-binding CsgD family transcriptional regulator